MRPDGGTLDTDVKKDPLRAQVPPKWRPDIRASSRRRSLRRVLPKHLKVLELLLEGKALREVSSLTGLNENQIRLIQKSPLFQDQFARRRGRIEKVVEDTARTGLVRAQEVLDKGVERAAEKLVSFIDHQDPRIARASAKDVIELLRDDVSSRSSAPLSIVFQGDNLQTLIMVAKESKEARGRKQLAGVVN